MDAQANEEVDAGGDIDGDDAAPPDRAAAKKSYLPSSLGLSVLVAPGVASLVACVVWGDYEWEKSEGGDDAPTPTDTTEGDPDGEPRPRGGYRRHPREAFVSIPLPAAGAPPLTVEVPDSTNVLEACRAAGVDVPHFCYHPRLSIVGQCRMCMVEIEGVPKVQASCTVPVQGCGEEGLRRKLARGRTRDRLRPTGRHRRWRLP